MWITTVFSINFVDFLYFGEIQCKKKLNSVQEFAKIKSWLLLICLMYRIAEPTLSKVCLMMMMMNCYCGMVDRRKASLISSRDHCQRSSPSRVSDTPWAGFEPAQNLSSGFVELSCTVVITTTPRRQIQNSNHAKK